MYYMDINFTGQISSEVKSFVDSAGVASVRFIANHTPAYYDNAEQRWITSETSEMHCVARNKTAEVIASSFSTGDRVLIFGSFRTVRTYDEEGNVLGTLNEVVIKDAGHSLVGSLM